MRSPYAANPRRADASSSELWASLSEEHAQKLLPLTGMLIAHAIREVQAAVPAYAQPLEGKFREILVGTIETSIQQAFESIVNPQAKRGDWKALFRYAGRVEYLEGRTMDDFQTAIRVGARTVWRDISARSAAMGIPTGELLAVADAIFTWVDELSTVAIEGYTAAQAVAVGSQQRHRGQLARMVLAGQAHSPAAVTTLAAAAGWRVPERLTVIVLDPVAKTRRLLESLSPAEVLHDLHGDVPFLLAPATADARETWCARLAGLRASIGPPVALADAPRSLQLAQRGLELAGRSLPALLWCADHLTNLLLLADEFLAEELAERALAPFGDLTAKQRERLAETLLAWLQSRGTAGEIATRLGVHPQTVRYRMQQLDARLGEKMNDPDERLAMEIGLRARNLLHATPDDGTPEA